MGCFEYLPANGLLLAVHGKALLLSALEDRRRYFLGVLAHREQVHVLRTDLPALQQLRADPVHQAAPVVAADEDDREVADLVRLAERQRLEELIERSEPARQHDEADRIANEEELAREEVA